MLGIDLTKISRFSEVNDKFINRVLHPEEVIEYNETPNKEKYIATRWAIKEALYKADNNIPDFKEIRIVKSDRKYSYEGYNISTSNEDDFIIAIAQKENHE